MSFRRFFAVLAMALILAGPAAAADWVVTRLRGNVELLDAAGNWVPLKRGDVVPNEQMVRTSGNGHAELTRTTEVVTLGNNTTIRIHDDAETGYTTVLQDFGRVEVDAEARRVKHFEVQTPYLAAVVKGTHFVVTSSGDGASVKVERGAVAVHSVATERSTTIGVGQTATVKRKTDLVVGGLGPWPPVVEPGVSRTKVTAAIGSALSSPAGQGLPQLPSAPMAVRPATGTVQLTAASSGLLVGFATTETTAAKADTGPAQPVSLGVVVIGALLGAAMGAIALLLRRGI